MKALGTDFAYLIPDYETDIYLNPNLIGEKLTSVSYEPSMSSPLTFRVLTKRFGWFSQYWGSYLNDKFRSGAGAVPNNRTSIFMKDMWLLDLRGKLPKLFASDVWNLYNDGSYNETRFCAGEYWYDTTRTFKYILSVSGSHHISTRWSIVDKLCGGVYHYHKNSNDWSGAQTADQWLTVYSAKIGLFYRDTIVPNRFTSFYFRVGGPVSTREVDNLPYSIFSSVPDTGDIEHAFFAKAFITELGFAKSFPVGNDGFVAVGLCDNFLFQQTEMADTNIMLRAINNRFSLPTALEYSVGRVSFRFGTNVSYELDNRREWDSDSTLAFTNEHTFSFAYSFGLATQPINHLVIDLYNVNNLAEISDWAICFKYVP